MIDRLGHLLQGIGRVGAVRKPGAQGAAATGAPTDNALDAPGSGSAQGSQGLRERIVQRVASLDPADPRRRRLALRTIVEAHLLAQFGERLINDAGFQQVVDDVVATLDADPGLQADVQAALDDVLAPPAS